MVAELGVTLKEIRTIKGIRKIIFASFNNW